MLSKFCRTCAFYFNGNHKLLPAYNQIKINENYELSLSEAVVILGLEIEKDDGLPQQLCINCVKQLTKIFTFREKCKKSQVELKELFKNNKISNLNIKEDIESVRVIYNSNVAQSNSLIRDPRKCVESMRGFIEESIVEDNETEETLDTTNSLEINSKKYENNMAINHDYEGKQKDTDSSIDGDFLQTKEFDEQEKEIPDDDDQKTYSNLKTELVTIEQNILKVGDRFQSYKEFIEKLEEYEEHVLHNFCIWSSTTLQYYLKKCSEYTASKFNNNLKYFSIRFSCIKGKRKSDLNHKSLIRTSIKEECEAGLYLRITSCRQYLELIQLNENHNHDILKHPIEDIYRVRLRKPLNKLLSSSSFTLPIQNEERQQPNQEGEKKFSHNVYKTTKPVTPTIRTKHLNNNEYQSNSDLLKIGDRFRSVEEFNRKLRRYENRVYCIYSNCINRSRTLKNRFRTSPIDLMNVNQKLKFYFLCIICSEGIKNSNTHTQHECKSEILLKLTNCGQYLEIIEFNTNHNHSVSKSAFLKSRCQKLKFSSDIRKCIRNALELNIDKKFIQKIILEETGYLIKRNDLDNIGFSNQNIDNLDIDYNNYKMINCVNYPYALSRLIELITNSSSKNNNGLDMIEETHFDYNNDGN